MNDNRCTICGDALRDGDIVTYLDVNGIEIVLNCPGCGAEYRCWVRWEQLDFVPTEAEDGIDE